MFEVWMRPKMAFGVSLNMHSLSGSSEQCSHSCLHVVSENSHLWHILERELVCYSTFNNNETWVLHKFKSIMKWNSQFFCWYKTFHLDFWNVTTSPLFCSCAVRGEISAHHLLLKPSSSGLQMLNPTPHFQNWNVHTCIYLWFQLLNHNYLVLEVWVNTSGKVRECISLYIIQHFTHTGTLEMCRQLN